MTTLSLLSYLFDLLDDRIRHDTSRPSLRAEPLGHIEPHGIAAPVHTALVVLGLVGRAGVRGDAACCHRGVGIRSGVGRLRGRRARWRAAFEASRLLLVLGESAIAASSAHVPSRKRASALAISLSSISAAYATSSFPTMSRSAAAAVDAPAAARSRSSATTPAWPAATALAKALRRRRLGSYCRRAKVEQQRGDGVVATGTRVPECGPPVGVDRIELRATREEERGDIGVAGRGRGDECLAEVELEVVVLEQVLDADRVAVGARGEKLGGELQAAVRRAEEVGQVVGQASHMSRTE